MTSRAFLIAGAIGLSIAVCNAVAANALNYNPSASATAARNWQYLAQNLAPQVSAQGAEDPQGPTLIASRPVPDTPANRARFGQPLSRAGRMTAPIGD